jgi:starch phosphorylase
MARLTAEFSATRTIREYTENHYLPAASCYRERAAVDSALGASLLRWHQDIDQYWNTVRFGSMEVATHNGQHFLQVEVFPGNLNPDQLTVELYADSIPGSEPAIEPMTAAAPRADSSGWLVYSAQIPASRPASDYTARIIPHHPNASVPLEAEQVLWQR